MKEFVNLLRSYVRSEQVVSDTFCALVFVERRLWTYALCAVIERDPILRSFLRAAPLTGHGAAGTDTRQVVNADVAIDEGMGLKEQYDTIQRFRSGALNILVSTNVAMEGLDVRACRLVCWRCSMQCSSSLLCHLMLALRLCACARACRW